MSYYNRKYNSRYGHRNDSGANDEGFYVTYCNSCMKKTEHDHGYGCLACNAKKIIRERAVKS
jgi:hypothetical protein